MKSQFELLAPGGDLGSVKAAIAAGADAVYLGLEKFNARSRASNISLDQLDDLCILAHQQNCKIFVALNIILLESELPTMTRLLNRLVNIAIDGIIAQDLGLLHMVKQHFPSLDAHASTQLNTHNIGQISLLNKLGVSRVNLARELNIEEIKLLADYGHQHNVLMEVFVHGSYCIGFSGLCYISSVRNGCSGNRGRCSQPCRDQYQTTQMGKDFPLNLKDNSAFHDLQALADAGVYSLKVEGRMKQAHYVYTVVGQWRQQLDRYYQSQPLLSDSTPLYKVFNRDFSNGYLKGKLSQQMYIDNSRNHALQHFSQQQSALSESARQVLKQSLYDDNTALIANMQQVIDRLSISQIPVKIKLIAKLAQPLKLIAHCGSQQFILCSEENLQTANSQGLSTQRLQDLFTINNRGYCLAALDVSEVSPGLAISVKSLFALKQQFDQLVLRQPPKVKALDPSALNCSVVASADKPITVPRLAVLVDDHNDLELAEIEEVDLYWHLPNAFADSLDDSIALFQAKPRLKAWFPAILIGEHYQAAGEFLRVVQPKLLVTNNSGIGALAQQLGLNWIAGPQLNTANSWAMQALQQQGGCDGAFVSNELNAGQMRQLKAPQGFRCFYSIYHPIKMLTSRQCLFQQVVGCKKTQVDHKCLRKCVKTSSIINLKDAEYVISKKAGEHNSLYSQQHFLNSEILTKLPGIFSDVLVDLRDVKNQTRIAAHLTKQALIAEFVSLLNAEPNADQTLHSHISPTQIKQYYKGL
ncbi:peptidase U32 family protein [Agarivorans sp. QJM3NY_29]|uniref:peptidase U32 family protein n=1 Tax=unclassified Agarivorans TaxID=2636026 RepID=UPI003D7F02DE